MSNLKSDKVQSAAQYERLALLAEELSEALHAVCKIQRFGFFATDPNTGKSYDNKAALMDELGHVSAAVCLLEVAGDIRLGGYMAAYEGKAKTLHKSLRERDNKNYAAEALRQIDLINKS